MNWIAAVAFVALGVAIGASALTVYIVLKFKSWY